MINSIKRRSDFILNIRSVFYAISSAPIIVPILPSTIILIVSNDSVL